MRYREPITRNRSSRYVGRRYAHIRCIEYFPEEREWKLECECGNVFLTHNVTRYFAGSSYACHNPMCTYTETERNIRRAKRKGELFTAEAGKVYGCLRVVRYKTDGWYVAQCVNCSRVITLAWNTIKSGVVCHGGGTAHKRG